jgi:hypothetical protein
MKVLILMVIAVVACASDTAIGYEGDYGQSGSYGGNWLGDYRAPNYPGGPEYYHPLRPPLVEPAPVPQPQQQYCTILCRLEVRANEIASEMNPAKPDRRCVGFCGNKSGCELVLAKGAANKLYSPSGRCRVK